MSKFALITFAFVFALSLRAPAAPPSADDANETTDTQTGEAADAVDKTIIAPVITTSPAPREHDASIEGGTEMPALKSIEPETPAEEVAKPAVSDLKVEIKAKTKSTQTKTQTKSVSKIVKEKAIKKSAKKVTAEKAPKPAAKAAAFETAPLEASATGDVSAEQSLKWLRNGNTRFVEKKFRADGKSEADRERTAKDQKPHAIILSCSDSRVPPELIFDQGLGEITTIRVAGEVLDSSVIASIESAIQNQHPHLLIVLGHTQCDSIEAALNWKEKASNGSEALDRMSAEMKPHFKTLASGAPVSPGLQVEAALQADGVARDLTSRSEIIQKAVDAKELTIKTGLYWVDTGKVKFY